MITVDKKFLFHKPIPMLNPWILMKRLLLLFAAISLAFSVSAQFSVKITVSGLPDYQPKNDSIFIAGNFNNWNPAARAYRLQPLRGKGYSIELQLAAGHYEYKLTRGGWDKAECKAKGAAAANRQLAIQSDTIIIVSVEDWADHFAALPRLSTANAHVKIIDTAFYMPQLKKSRRVWIYLPGNYDFTTKNYPVLYMHDGQNVFDDLSSFSGEWGVDEALDTLEKRHREIIVVAVDHGGDKRMNEYSPYDMERYGKGEGDQYVDFLVETLKPFIDNNYRSRRGKKNTFIAGSSMGGLISLYAVMKYPKVFGGAGIFSPAIWIAPAIETALQQQKKKIKSRLYFYAGMQESQTMVPDMLKVFEIFNHRRHKKMISVIRAGGQHNESNWRKEFPLFYKWIF